MDDEGLSAPPPQVWPRAGSGLPAERVERPPHARTPIRRVLGRGASLFHRLLLETPPGRWLHRRLVTGRHLPLIDVPVPASAASLDGLTIAFLSDVHAGTFLFERELAQLAERVMEARPDLIALGGDLIDTDLRELELFDRALGVLRAPLGVFAVPGNHDYYEPETIGAWGDYLRERGVEVLTNRGRRCERDGTSLWIAGVDDLTEGWPDLERALRGRRAGEPTILLSHHPDVFPDAVRHGVELQLSGHTHGGQVRLFGWAPMMHSDHGYLAGLYAGGGSRLWVSNGVGVTMLPIRIGTRAEVGLLRLTCG